MAREGLEVADVFRHFGPAFRDRHGASLSTARRRAMSAIEHCRTAALGGHVERCGECGHQRIAYNSCLMGKFSNGESKVTIPRFMLLLGRFALHYCGIPEQGDQLVRRPEGAFAQVCRRTCGETRLLCNPGQRWVAVSTCCFSK
jgi:hypothetical protein